METNNPLPSTKVEWERAVKMQNLPSSIYEYAFPQSASKIELDQYLLLRVLRPRPQLAAAVDASNSKEKWLNKESLNSAEKVLDEHPSWKDYLTSFNEPNK
jgi:hypothetical protein